MLLAAAQGAGWGLCTSAFAGAFVALRRPGPRRCLALFFWLTSLILCLRFTGIFSETNAMRMYVSVVAIGALLAADFLLEPGRRLVWKGALLGFLIIEGGWRCAVILENARISTGKGSTRVRAADWIEAHVPAGASVGLVRYPEPAHTPPFRFDYYHLILFDSPAHLPTGREPDYLVVDQQGRSIIEPWAENRYDVVQAFRPWPSCWTESSLEDYFLNNAMFVYRRRGIWPARAIKASPAYFL
jgi:hypothetical protein